MKVETVGSICSGIEAASVAWLPLGMKFSWFSEIEDFPSRLLRKKYSDILNVGDMRSIPKLIEQQKIIAPDLICGGTPCQAFSLAGHREGTDDEIGNLTLRFIDIINSNDDKKNDICQKPSIVFWENVEGVLSDKTNAFGCLVCSLAGFNEVIERKKWPSAGVIHGTKRNVAWRVLDAKYFGVPQQRRRLYLMAGGKDFFPENVLFEFHANDLAKYPSTDLSFKKEGHRFEVFRGYTDCLYSAYGTKWNGNAAAYNGSLFVVQDGKIRRFSPLECERLMGFPDNYTSITKATNTSRYKAIGNSWAVPVIKWLGKRILEYEQDYMCLDEKENFLTDRIITINDGTFISFDGDIIKINNTDKINCSVIPEKPAFKDMSEIISSEVNENLYLSSKACYGILRRARENNININERLKQILKNTN